MENSEKTDDLKKMEKVEKLMTKNPLPERRLAMRITGDAYLDYVTLFHQIVTDDLSDKAKDQLLLEKALQLLRQRVDSLCALQGSKFVRFEDL